MPLGLLWLLGALQRSFIRQLLLYFALRTLRMDGRGTISKGLSETRFALPGPQGPFKGLACPRQYEMHIDAIVCVLPHVRVINRWLLLVASKEIIPAMTELFLSHVPALQKWKSEHEFVV